MSESPYRDLPGIDALLRAPELQALDLGPALLAEAARAAVAAARGQIRATGAPVAPAAIVADAAARAEALSAGTLRPVLNATGVIVHTNLGRAPLDASAIAAVTGACNLEYDLDAGRRGSRRAHAERLLVALSGAEAALVVNNNAAAVYLALATFATGREVIISRGELVEIGGSFRVPDILAASGARLREVGTTNRTYVRDFEAAIGPETAAILRVHPSNYRVTGFTHTPDSAELSALARARGIHYMNDVGSGTLAPLPGALSGEGDPRLELQAGADLVCFSGDKLLGGPQAGIVLGRSELVERMARHPMARALRIDKLGLAALEHTLRAYRSGHPERVPVYRMLHATPYALGVRARALAERLAPCPADLEVIDCEDAVGGGSHPETGLPGKALAISPRDTSAEAVATRLRANDPPVVATIASDRLVVHLRTVDPERDADLADALSRGLIEDG